VVSFIVAAGGLLLGDLNAIAAVLSMFFLTSYGALNLVSGLEGLIDNPSWRPTFRISWVLSFLGAFLCFGAMFMINSGASFVAFGLVTLIYFVMRKRNVKSNYSDIRSGLIGYFARSFIYKLNHLPTDARNWRPNFLVLSGPPHSRFHLIDLAYEISHRKGFMTISSILTDPELGLSDVNKFEKSAQNFLGKKNIEGLIKFTRSESVTKGAVNLIENYGVGAVAPNTLLLGDCNEKESVRDFVKIIKSAYQAEKNVVIVRDSKDTIKTVSQGGESIDVWWRGNEGNVSLMLTLAYMLKTSNKWISSQLTLKSVSEDAGAKSSVEGTLHTFLEKSRIPASHRVYVKGEQDIFSLMAQSSQNTDIVFIGLKPPETNDDYATYFEHLLEKTSKFKTAVFVLESEKISFVEIFQ
jgi:hypothetical protein